MKYVIRSLIGIILVVAIGFAMMHAISWQDVLRSMHELSWENIILIVGIVVLVCIVKATRFFFILRFGGIRISLKNTIRIFIASQLFTPLPAGEVGRAMLFKKEANVHLKDVAGPVLLQSLTELWTATIWVVVLFFVVGGQFGYGWILLLVGLLALLTIPLLFSKQLVRLFEHFERRGIRRPWMQNVQRTFEHMKRLVSSEGKTHVRRFWIRVFVSGLLAHALYGGLMWYVAYTEGVPLSIAQGIFLASMGALIQGIFTVIPGGLGVTDGGLVGILTQFSVPRPEAIVLTLLYRFATLPLLLAIAAVFFLAMRIKDILAYAFRLTTDGKSRPRTIDEKR